MNLRQYIFIFGFGTGVAFAAWLLVVTQFSPESIGWIGLLAFYVTFFAWFMGLLSTAGTMLRAFTMQGEQNEHPIVRSLRQAFLLSALVTLMLFLMSQGLLHTWIIILLVLFVILIEFFLLSVQKNT